MAFIEREALVFSDEVAIAELQKVFALQKKAFLANTSPTLNERLALLQALADMMLNYRIRIQEAVASDFGSHPAQFSDLVECLGVAGRAKFVAERLAEWVKPHAREVDPALFGNARAYVQQQPKGVVGNMVPWNFPFDIGIGPVVEMLAAGNRVIVKPSDLTPACSELTLEMIRATFDQDQVAAVAGGIELAKHFPTLEWDHLMYTGSTEVGRLVAVAAAQNLTPVTLELGGKCPALVAEDGINYATIEQIIGCKTIKNGQMCVTVDYVLIPEAHRDHLVDLLRQRLESTVPDYAKHKDVTGIINERHMDRLQRYLDDASEKGATLLSIGGESDRATRRMPLTLVLDPSDDMEVMRNEIFGPILPIKTYRTLDEAIDYINAHDRPLGIYVFTETPSSAQQILDRTVSGGACVNAAAMHAALPSLPFGGIGKSGTGRHHGLEGFLEFSNPRAVFERGNEDLIAAMYAPYGELADAVISGALESDH
ncbi:aldehyde dehydrogenase family protein [Halopseudomonas salina]|uniref:Aldehyde dehydrogenase n=1 Tax=Halopseudomonas salina TaxID=1323744 RepID=A0ABQ1PXF9_9GAMM|nr:aldehyde dehydrogenase family protein [Halopseudomonas salina]GGD06553.1 putative coniferyl aldehyde dehydrogenase [Halopseudomonas salina]